MQVKGRIHHIGQTQTVSDKFSKREVVVTTADQYPQSILIQFTQDKVSMLDGLQIGQEVDISINLRGREWTSPQGEVKWFNTIEGWKIDANAPQGQSSMPPIATDTDTDTDLPF